jgi:hypothetical protein
MQKSTRINLTKNRARILIETVVPFLEVHFEQGEGDLFSGNAQEWDRRDLSDLESVIQWIYQEGVRHFRKPKKKPSLSRLSKY